MATITLRSTKGAPLTVAEVDANFSNLNTAKLESTSDLNASRLTSGTVATARLGGGTANTTTWLRGDGNWTSLAASATTDATNASNISSGTLANARTTAIATNTANTIVLRDAGGNFSAGSITSTGITSPNYQSADVTSGASGAVTLTSGISSATTGASTGALTLRTGNVSSATGSSGNVTLTSGTGGTTTSASGSLSLTTGNTVGTSGVAGAITIKPGFSIDAGLSGSSIQISGGNNNSTAANTRGGVVSIFGGAATSTSAVSKTGGDVIIEGGGVGVNGIRSWGTIQIGKQDRTETSGTDLIIIGGGGAPISVQGNTTFTANFQANSSALIASSTGLVVRSGAGDLNDRIIVKSSGTFGSDGRSITLTTPGLALGANQTITLPDATGTVALTSQLPGQATATTLGLIKLGSNTAQTVAPNTVTAATSRSYAVQLTADGQAVVNVPWVDIDTDTTYSQATSSALGLIKLGSDAAQTVAPNTVTTTASRSYAIQVNASGQAVVNVPWVDTDTNTVTRLRGTTSGTYTSGDLTLLAGTNVAITQSGSEYTISSTDTTYSQATSSALGLIKLGSDAAQTVAANAVSATALRSYAVQVNASGQAVVNVPWTDTDTNTVTRLRGTTSGTYTSGDLTLVAGTNVTITQNGSDYTINSTDTNTTYSKATSTVLGLVELFSDTVQTTAANAVSTTTSRTYGIQLNGSDQAVVNVPWTDTTYSQATSSALGLIKLGFDTAQTVAANAVSATASRTYAVQVNASGQAVVNVPWVDTDTNTITRLRGTTSGTYTSGDLTLVAGTNVTVTQSGSDYTISATGGSSITDDNTTDATQYLGMSRATSGTWSTAYVASTKLYFNPSTGTLNSTAFNSLSDSAHKTNVVKADDKSILSVEGVEFDWKDTGKKSAGVIAQQLEEILPHLVDTNESGTKSVNYNGLIAYLIETVKHLDARVKQLENTNA